MKNRDLAATLLALVLALVAIGVIMVYSTTVVPCDKKLDDPTFYLRRQILWAVLAFMSLLLARHTDYHAVVRWRTWIWGAILPLLVAVLFFSRDVKGAHRWFDLGTVHIQPSEIAKIALLIFLAGHCAEEGSLATWRRAAPAFGATALTVGLIILERDLGTAAFVGMLGALLLLVAGVRLTHAALVGPPALAAVALYAATHLEHVKTRIEVFLNPGADPLGKGYQINQALIALGSGGPFGLGIGESRQKLFFLPDDHTDFILAILGEETGIFGTMLIAALFAAFVVFGMRVALRAKDRLGFLVAFGVTTMVGLQGAMNMAVVTASMPTKGISLPFVSFGGSSLVIALSAVGILLNVARQANEPAAAPAAAAPARERALEVQHA